MFARSLRNVPAVILLFPAHEYLSAIPERSLAGGYEYQSGSIEDVLSELIAAINPSTKISLQQQAFIGDQFNTIFKRYFAVREQVGLDNADYDRDMRLLRVATIINNMPTTRPWFPGLTRVVSVHEVLERCKEDELIPLEVDPLRISELLINEVADAVPLRAMMNQQQAHYVGRLLAMTICRYFDELREIGEASSYMRKAERFLALAEYCSSCTGR